MNKRDEDMFIKQVRRGVSETTEFDTHLLYKVYHTPVWETPIVGMSKGNGLVTLDGTLIPLSSLPKNKFSGFIELHPVHPAELENGSRLAWQQFLWDREWFQPYPQLDRPVYEASPKYEVLAKMIEQRVIKSNQWFHFDQIFRVLHNSTSKMVTITYLERCDLHVAADDEDFFTGEALTHLKSELRYALWRLAE